jgi:hypothetical protein
VLILFVVALVVAIVITVARQWAQRKRKCQAAAEKIHGEMTAMYRSEHSFRIVRETAFPGLDLTGYREAREFLTSRGFVSLGAIENLTVTAVYPENRTFMAAYANAAGDVGAYFYEIRKVRVLDFSTWLEGDRLLLTTSGDADKLTPPPSVNREALPADTSFATLLARHLERLEALRATERAAIRSLASMDEVLEACRRHSRLVGEHRRSVGFLTEAEMLRFAAPGQGYAARRVFKHFHEIVASGPTA